MKLIEALQEIANNKEVHFSTKLRGSELTVNYFGVDDFTTISGSMLSIGDIIRCLNQEIQCVKTNSKDVTDVKNKKIRKLGFIEENTFRKRQNGMTSEDRRLLDSNFRELGNKINEIIDKLNAEADKDG